MKKFALKFYGVCLLFGVVIIGLFYFSEIEPRKTSGVKWTIVKTNTSVFDEGDLLILDGILRVAINGDTASVLGIVTKVGEDGEVLLKYKK